MKNSDKSNFNPESQMMTYGFNPALSQGSDRCPIFQTSTYCFPNAQAGENFFAVAYGLRKPEVDEDPGLIYLRLNHPALQIAEERLTLYEKGAEACAIFASGMAAITTVCYEILRPGDLILCSSPLYGGTDHYLNEMLPSRGINVLFFDKNHSMSDIINLVNDKGMAHNLAMILVETPANPTNDIFDIEMLSKVADHFSKTRDEKVLLTVDNTYMGPIWQNPIVNGADIVLYSLTKYVGGHSDLTAGACLGSKEIIGRIKTCRTFLGNMSDPDTCALLLRSLETLSIRMEKHAYNADKIAAYLLKHPMVEKLYFLGNLSPKNLVKNKQCNTNGGMIAFDVKGGKEAAYKFVNSLKLARLAVSLGSTGSLVEIPYFMTHAGVNPETKKLLGIGEGMVRLSVGIENYKDLIQDIKQAFKIKI